MQSKEIPDQKVPGRLADQHWSEVMDAAKRYGFVAQAYGGTALLLTHRVQLDMEKEVISASRRCADTVPETWGTEAV